MLGHKWIIKRKQIKKRQLYLNNAILFFTGMSSDVEMIGLGVSRYYETAKFLVRLAERQFHWIGIRHRVRNGFVMNSSESSDPLIPMQTDPSSKTYV